MSFKSGRHFLQIPGPSNVPDRILRAMNSPTIDHRGPDFSIIGKSILKDLKKIFKTEDPVIIFPASGTGAWEAALINTLSKDDRILMAETGHFAELWFELANQIGLRPELLPGDWRHGAQADQIELALKNDRSHEIKAVCIVHNETSTGATSNIKNIRRAIDNAKHPALLIVDTISSLASIDYHHGAWGVDVTVSGSQKGLMLPPGLSFNAVSKKAIQASEQNNLNRSYWNWASMIQNNETGFFPYTPATNLLYGLRESLDILFEEGLEHVFSRHKRLADATRIAVQAWGVEILCQNPDEYSNSLTAILMPNGINADIIRKIILEKFNMSLGTGLGKVKEKVLRIGHLGDLNELTLIGTLAGVEMGLSIGNVPHQTGGTQKAMTFLADTK